MGPNRAPRAKASPSDTDPQCPPNVNSSRPLRANTGHSAEGSAKRVKSTRRRYSRKLPVSAPAAFSMTPTTIADTVSACLGSISVSLGSAVPKSWNWRKSRPFRHRVRGRSGSRCSPPGLASPIPSSVAADIRHIRTNRQLLLIFCTCSLHQWDAARRYRVGAPSKYRRSVACERAARCHGFVARTISRFCLTGDGA